jgi:hypothetical protein
MIWMWMKTHEEEVANEKAEEKKWDNLEMEGQKRRT